MRKTLMKSAGALDKFFFQTIQRTAASSQSAPELGKASAAKQIETIIRKQYIQMANKLSPLTAHIEKANGGAEKMKFPAFLERKPEFRVVICKTMYPSGIHSASIAMQAGDMLIEPSFLHSL